MSYEVLNLNTGVPKSVTCVLINFNGLFVSTGNKITIEQVAYGEKNMG